MINKLSILIIALIFTLGILTTCSSSRNNGRNSSGNTSTGTAESHPTIERNQKNSNEAAKTTPLEKPKSLFNKDLPDCRKYQVTDNDRLDFASGKIVKIDADGDGEFDTITPRDYKVAGKDKSDPAVNELHWIAFDLKTSGGKENQSFFKYNYGNNLADYYVYSLVPCNSNTDEKVDLLFYTGDDNSEETVILESTGNSFKEISRKKSDIGDQ